jgi:hypothetical protein
MFRPVSATECETTIPIVLTPVDLPGFCNHIAVPAGFTFDGASIPRFAWVVIGAPFEPDYQLAACVHDWICERSNELGNYEARVMGDALFFLLLARAGVPRWKRVAMYLAVRLNSWWRYGRNEVQR